MVLLSETPTPAEVIEYLHAKVADAQNWISAAIEEVCPVILEIDEIGDLVNDDDLCDSFDEVIARWKGLEDLHDHLCALESQLEDRRTADPAD
jgi:hypothetical protein